MLQMWRPSSAQVPGKLLKFGLAGTVPTTAPVRSRTEPVQPYRVPAGFCTKPIPVSVTPTRPRADPSHVTPSICWRSTESWKRITGVVAGTWSSCDIGVGAGVAEGVATGVGDGWFGTTFFELSPRITTDTPIADPATNTSATPATDGP